MLVFVFFVFGFVLWVVGVCVVFVVWGDGGVFGLVVGVLFFLRFFLIFGLWVLGVGFFGLVVVGGLFGVVGVFFFVVV
ncbi:hypothetical protein, partial [Yersinia massiliensis]|uniref:hypothetical protein n=1 Tax=Yersinia massiliensis TaxID=419257 RepID=UPI001C97385F